MHGYQSVFVYLLTLAVCSIQWPHPCSTLWGDCSDCDSTGDPEWKCPLAAQAYNNLMGYPAGSPADIIEINYGEGQSAVNIIRFGRGIPRVIDEGKNLPTWGLAKHNIPRAQKCSKMIGSLPHVPLNVVDKTPCFVSFITQEQNADISLKTFWATSS